MSSKGRIIALAFAGVAFVQAEACAQGARVGADAQAVRHFVQGFYDWYTPLALGTHAFPAEYFVLTNADRYLDRGLATALRADSVAEEAGPMKATRETLNFDAFLDSQDPCGPYEVVDVARRGDTFRVRIRSCQPNSTGPVVEVRAMEGRWRITNVLYDKGDLKSYLCQWAKADLRHDKRPAKC